MGGAQDCMQIALAGTNPGVTFQSCPQPPLVLSRSKSQRLHNLPEEYSWPGTKCSDTGMLDILYSARIPHKDVSYHVEPSGLSLAETEFFDMCSAFSVRIVNPSSTTGCFAWLGKFSSLLFAGFLKLPFIEFRASYSVFYGLCCVLDLVS